MSKTKGQSEGKVKDIAKKIEEINDSVNKAKEAVAKANTKEEKLGFFGSIWQWFLSILSSVRAFFTGA